MVEMFAPSTFGVQDLKLYSFLFKITYEFVFWLLSWHIVDAKNYQFGYSSKSLEGLLGFYKKKKKLVEETTRMCPVGEPPMLKYQFMYFVCR